MKHPRKLSRREAIGLAVSGGLAAGALALNKNTVLAGVERIIRSRYFPAILLKKRPTIVLVTADTTRYDRCGFNGYKGATRFGDARSTTPYLDSLAEKGVVFDSCYSQSPFTLHSIGSMFTSRYVKNIFFSMSRSVNPCLGLGVNTTAAELLQQDGYRTCGAVSMPLLAHFDGFSRGFEQYSMPDQGKRKGDETVHILKEMILRHNPARQPGFYYLHLFQPHGIYLAPHEFKIFHTEGEFDNITKRYIWVRNSFKNCSITEKEAHRISNLYNAELFWADDNIKDFLEFLVDERYFKFEKDLFIFSSDHGENIMDHGMCGIHEGTFESTTHVPLLLCGGPAAGRKRIRALTMNIDIAPTIAETAGLPAPQNWEGKSLFTLTDDANETHEAGYSEDVHGSSIVSVFANGLRYTHRMPSTLNDDEIQAVDGFQPTGKVAFYGGPPSRFLLSWPRVGVGKSNVFTRLKIDRDILLYRDGVLQDDAVLADKLIYDDISCKKDITCYSENDWNSLRATDQLLRWSVQVYQQDGDRQIPLLTSGPLAAAFEPTPNYLELYDLQDDPGETRNLIHESQYQKKREKLEVLAKKYTSGKTQSNSEELSDKDRQTLRTLGYLK